jgi:hypothetical protein
MALHVIEEKSHLRSMKKAKRDIDRAKEMSELLKALARKFRGLYWL